MENGAKKNWPAKRVDWIFGGLFSTKEPGPRLVNNVRYKTESLTGLACK